MKIYKKDKLKYKNGMIVTKKGKVISINPVIVNMANSLDMMYQRTLYDMAATATREFAKVPEFEYESEHDIEEIKIDTPLLDEAVKNSLELMDEIDNVNAVDKLNDDLKKFAPLIRFVEDDEVISCEASIITEFDLPKLGNPLKLTKDKIMKILMMANGLIGPSEILNGKSE